MNGAILPAAEPGAHIDIHLPSGIERSYSLNDARERATKLHSRHQAQSRGDSKYFFDAMKVEQTLKISKPRNNFELVESGGHVVLIAGGIGITPADNSSISARLLRPRLSLRISIVVAPIRCSARSRVRPNICLPTRWTSSTSRHGRRRTSPADLLCNSRAPARNSRSPRQEHPRGAARRGSRAVLFLRGRRLRCMRDAADIRHSRLRDSVLSPTERAANKVIMVCCSGCKGDRQVLDI
jgi:hypothetical protein